MTEPFLYETLNAVESMGFLKTENPASVTLNLIPSASNTCSIRTFTLVIVAYAFRCYN